MFKAESNIVTEHGTIAKGETFNPDHYQIARKDLERWLSIGLVSRVKSVVKDKEGDGTPDDTTPAPESSVVDADDRRKSARKAGK